MSARRTVIALGLALVLTASSLTAVSSAASSSAATESARELPERYRAWLEEVAALMSEAERAAFLGLSADYQRRAFAERFWRVRDPYPETARNELRERWEERLEEARKRFGDLEGDRARAFMAFGPPATLDRLTCEGVMRTLEVWRYGARQGAALPATLVFVSETGTRRGRHRRWRPSEGVGRLADLGGPLAGAVTRDRIETVLRERCLSGVEMLVALESASEADLDPRATLPHPGDEWLARFTAYTTDVLEGAARFEAEALFSFPGRRQNRTVVQGVLLAPARDSVATLTLDGDVLRGGELFEQFHYRFRVAPDGAIDGRWPLVFERYLRPGVYRLVLKIHDVESDAFSRQELRLEVPNPRFDAASDEAGPVQAGPVPSADSAEGVGEAERRLAEANRVLTAVEASIELFAPPQELLVGKMRFAARATGDAIAKVRFELDGRPVLSKTRPPYSVELDLGSSPRVHEIRALALAADGSILAVDELSLNTGPHRFAVRLVEPQSGARYVESLRVQAALEVPEGERLDRLELYRDEILVTTLYQPPWVSPILLPRAGAVSTVRAVAYLADGTVAEDAVFGNAPDVSERLEVDFVELYTTVVTKKGVAVEGLTLEDFTVLEDGDEQTVARFERVVDRPIYAGIVLDTSLSMIEELDDAVAAALEFFRTVLREQDRAAVITFNDEPHLAVRFTNDPEVLAGGLSEVAALGNTALYDAIVHGLYYFAGVRGKRALILLSDGADEGSRYSFDEAVEYALETGVAVYPVGIGLESRYHETRQQLERLAAETGGDCFFVDHAGQLDRVYSVIEDELRAQYLLAYQSSHSGSGEGRYRRVEVKVGRPGLVARTIRGYRP